MQNLRPSGDLWRAFRPAHSLPARDVTVVWRPDLFRQLGRLYRCGTVRESHPTSTNNRTCIV